MTLSTRIFENSDHAKAYTERALWALWQRTAALTEGLVAQDGRRYKVAYPGRSNPRAGPDFLDAVLTNDQGERVVGDVEIHLNAPDWFNHRHHVDPNYNGVVLHVVLHPKGKESSPQKSGITAPIVSLAPVIERLEAQRIKPEPYPLPCDDLGDLLDEAGDQRFLSKSRGFAMELESDGPDETLYKAMMEAAGYASNRKAFRELADRVPLSKLGFLRYEPESTRPLAIKAMLINASGLVSRVDDERERAVVLRLRKLLPRTGSMSESRWNLFRVRPANHPVRRISGMAELLNRYGTNGLAATLARDVSGGERTADIISRLTVKPFIGRQRAGDMTVSVVLPFFHAYAEAGRDKGLADRCLELFRTCPRLADNEITREMTRVLRQRDPTLRITSARRQQGLIKLYKDRRG